MCFSAAASFRERPRQHELGLEHGAGFLDQPIQRGGHPGHGPVDHMALDVADPVAGVELVPAAVEVFGDQAELDDQDARQVGRCHLAPLFAPKAMEGLLVLAHDDPGVRAADEVTAVALLRRCRSILGIAPPFTELVLFVIVAPEFGWPLT